MRHSVAWPTLAVASVLSGVLVLPGPAVAQSGGGQTETLLDENFENVFPRLPWRVDHPAGAAAVDWGRTKFRASADRHSIYCAGMGLDAPADGGPAPAGTASWAIVGPFDLSETTSGTLSFDLWLDTEAYRDVFMWLVSTDGVSFSGSARSTDTAGWTRITTDLGAWGAAGSVIGQETVWIAFVYQSDHSNPFEGAYVDEVRLVVDVGAPGDNGRTYTTDADFAEGDLVGLESDSGTLALADGWNALPYLWVPNSRTGTVSKIDAESGAELGRYRTGPFDATDPGGVAVDLDGSCWVGNRGAGTVVKIGLVENGGCVDGDGDGGIETSRDSNGDGDITGSELLDWGADECVLLEVVLVAGREGPRVPGDDHDDYEANGLQAVAVDADGDLWAGAVGGVLYKVAGVSGEVLDTVDLAGEASSPTAALVDGDGTVWLASRPEQWLTAYNPPTATASRVDLPHGGYGLAADRAGGLYVTGDEFRLFSKVAIADQAVEWTQNAGRLARGVATTERGRIWVASAGDGLVSRYSPQGLLTTWATLPGGPTGLAVDQSGKIWVAGVDTEAVYRVEPDAPQTVLEKRIAGTAGHDASGDLTGIVVRNVTSRFGTWTVVHDSGVAATPWGTISWTASTPQGSQIRVRARSSEDRERWSAWEPVEDGADLGATPPGRYIEIQAALQQVSGDQQPTLTELRVEPAAMAAVPTAAFTWAPASPVVGESASFTDASTGDPATWSWDFGDGGASSERNPSHVFGRAGRFDVTLTVSNAAGSDSTVQSIDVAPGGNCTLTCLATAPQTASLNEVVAFAVDADSAGCSASPEYSWDFGDGLTSSERNPNHSYATTGTLRWRVEATADGASCVAGGDITVSGAGPDSCTHRYWVPVVSHADGAVGSVWRSDLGLLGSTAGGASVEMTFHGPGGERSKVVTVAPDAMVNLVDVVRWIDGSAEGSGSLEICADGELVIDSRTYNVLAADHPCFPAATFGQHLPGRSADAGLGAGETALLGQLRESAAFRTNIGVANTGDDPATVRIALRDATGATLTTFELDIAAGQWMQENRPFFNRASRADLDAASATVTVVDGGGVFVYASVIDNATSDPTTVLPQ